MSIQTIEVNYKTIWWIQRNDKQIAEIMQECGVVSMTTEDLFDYWIKNVYRDGK